MNEQLQQQKRRLLLVKYGGSAVTIKDRLETLHPEALHSCADHVSELLRTNAALGPDDYRTEIVIVHGAGTVDLTEHPCTRSSIPWHSSA
jgi:isopentenyl phosphate kinase